MFALRLDYTYTAHNLPATIDESAGGTPTGFVTFTYDNRGRLIHEVRTGTSAYDLAYEYDQGGNRTKKRHGTGTQLVFNLKRGTVTNAIDLSRRSLFFRRSRHFRRGTLMSGYCSGRRFLQRGSRRSGRSELITTISGWRKCLQQNELRG